MLKIFLWLRYLSKRKIVYLSVAAVGLSVALLIVVASLFTGFITTFEKAAVVAVGDIVLNPAQVIDNYDVFIKRLEETEEIEAATAILNGYGLLHLDMGHVRAVDIWGIEPERRSKVVGFEKFLLSQKDFSIQQLQYNPENTDAIGAFIGISVLSKPNEKTDEYDYQAVKEMIGKQVWLTTGTVAQADSDIASRADIKRKLIEITIEDVVETGIYQFDNSCIYLPIEQLSKTLYPGTSSPVAEQIHIKIAEQADIEDARFVISSTWRWFIEEYFNNDTNLLYRSSISTARELQGPLIAAYQQQMRVLLVIFGIISFGVVLLVFCIFYMIVKTKQKDIAIIKSCGASSGSVAFVFIGFGAVIGILGSGLGTALGYLITRNINIIEHWISIVFGLKLWKSSVYLFSMIPNEVNWPWVLWIVISAIIAAAIGAVIPAAAAALTNPVKILRYE